MNIHPPPPINAVVSALVISICCRPSFRIYRKPFSLAFIDIFSMLTFGCLHALDCPILTAGKFAIAVTAVARTLMGGGGGCLFIYSCSARLVSFEITFKSINLKRN